MKIADLLRVVRNRHRLLARDRWTREQLLDHQARELAALREFAYLRSPFYRTWHEGLTDAPLEELPVLTKAQLMHSFDDVVTVSGLTLARVQEHLARTGGAERLADRYTVSLSSGSTGQPGFFVFDPGEWAMVLASYGRGAWWAGLNPSLGHLFDPVRAVVYTSPVPWHQTAQVRAAAQTRLMPTLALDGTRAPAEVVDELNLWMPEYIATYASLARALAQEQLAGRLHISPRVIGVGGEVLTGEARRVIEQAWGQVLFDTYGASETGVLAIECSEHRGLHLCEDLCIIEVVDAQGRPVPPGEYGERVLVTVLYRRTQPLIRYEISDKLRLSPHACPCGRPFRLLESVQGRVEETLHFARAGGNGDVAIDPVVFEAVLDTVRATQWQVVQQADAIELLLVGLAPDASAAAIEQALQRAIESRGAIAPPVRVRQVAAIPRGATGKAPLIRKAG